MTRMRLLALFPLLAVLLLGGVVSPTVALAVTPDDVASALQKDPVYVEPDAEHAGDVDKAKVESQIRSSAHRIFVAVLPARDAQAYGGAKETAKSILLATGQLNSVVIALVGDQLVAVAGPSTPFGNGQAQRAVDGVSGSTTDKLVQAVRNVQQLKTGGTSGSSGTSGSGGTTSSGGGHGGALILAVLALIAVVGGVGLYGRARTKRRRELDGLRADVESLYNRLGSDVSTLSAGDDAVARQALSDAAERYNATGALLAHADTPGEFSAARRTAVEGLTAARTARQRLGLDPGPEIAPPPGSGPQLTEAQRVRVGDQEYEGSPQYAPGRGHYYGGGFYNGQVVPGGWYAFPFWETMLMTSVLTGGFGAFGGGFGGGGYERGYEEGVEDSRDAHSGGGDWGGGGGGGDWGGGGDFGGGGGDFGGGGGGGDW
jgi:hypothetical protein